MTYTYEHERPALTVDCVVFGLDVEENDLKVLLIQRGIEPHLGAWALPGGFLRIKETLEEAALRELKDETGVDRLFLEQLYTFGDIARDPRERVITVAYYALINLNDHPLKAATDAQNVAWFSLKDLPALPFDHDNIVEAAVTRLQGKVVYEPIGFELLPAKFTLTQLQCLYEIVLERPLDRRNFRKKILGMGILVALEEIEKDVAHRAARLYTFDEAKYRQLKKRGFIFEL